MGETVFHIDAWTVSPEGVAVFDIIVDEGKIVEEFNGGGNGENILCATAEGFTYEHPQRRTQSFPPSLLFIAIQSKGIQETLMEVGYLPVLLDELEEEVIHHAGGA
jgi:hypothetical protein